MPVRRTEGPHVHGYRVDSECPDELCRAFYRGYKRGLRRERRDARTRNADMIAELRAATRSADHENGPVIVRGRTAGRPNT